MVFQGYQLYCDNFYSSPMLFKHLKEWEITATGTFRINRRGILEGIVSLKTALDTHGVPKGKAITFITVRLCTYAGVTHEQ